MGEKFKMFIAGCVLAGYIFCGTGCAAAWFLAGVGTAATVATVASENEKAKEKAKKD